MNTIWFADRWRPIRAIAAMISPERAIVQNMDADTERIIGQIQRLHYKDGGGFCAEDGAVWPCSTIRVVFRDGLPGAIRSGKNMDIETKLVTAAIVAAVAWLGLFFIAFTFPYDNQPVWYQVLLGANFWAIFVLLGAAAICSLRKGRDR